MKKSIIILVFALFVFTGVHTNAYAFEKTSIGQRLWLMQKPKNQYPIGFLKSIQYEDLTPKEKVDLVRQKDFNFTAKRELFYPADTVEFQILKKVQSGGKVYCRKYYQVRFNDGFIAFINPRTIERNLSDCTVSTLTKKNLSIAKHDIGGLRPFFKENPAQIKKKIIEIENTIENCRKEREARGGVSIGMTKAQVLSSSWDKPISVNKTITKTVVHEQWVYSGQNYLYFGNNRLTSIQTSK